MKAKIFSLSPEVREAALDVKAIRRKIKESRDRWYEWLPAEANARQRMVSMSLQHGGDQEKLPSQLQTRPKTNERFLKLVR